MQKRFSVGVGVAAIVALGAILCSVIWTRALVRVRSGEEIIRVVGSARKPIHSDFIIWSSGIRENAPIVARGYANLKTKMAIVQSYLQAKGVPAADVSPLAITVETLYARPRTVTGPNGTVITEGESAFRPAIGYRMKQGIEIHSDRVDLVERISRQSTELLGKGVVLESEAPMYLYTKMSELKVTMQAEAARDARNRAAQIATNAGCRLGEVRFARMNVPSITPLYASSEDDGGVDDTTALDKKITAVVVVGYSIH
jgi:uncharacterized protein